MSDSTPQPYFPQDIDNYALWVARYGLLFPYGECQCGCGQKSPISSRNRAREGYTKGHPVRALRGHSVNKLSYDNLKDAFWAHCDKLGPEDCWPWDANRDRNGYGKLKHKGQYYRAHRVSYLIHKGEIADDHFVCHHCDTPWCCNPVHLFLGTVADNKADEVAKGRHVKGEATASAKLTSADVQDIRQRLMDGQKYKNIAPLYNVKPDTIRCIDNGKNWKHAP